MYYVYVYLDPRKCGNFNYGKYNFEYEPFYVGKGKRFRHKFHLYANSSNKCLMNKINNIKKANESPVIIKIEEMLSESDAFDLEIELISLIKKQNVGGTLCNLTDGGEGVSGYKHTDECKKLLSKLAKTRFKDPAEREKISKGIKNSEIWKEAVTSSEFSKKMSESHLDPNGFFQRFMKSDEFSNTMKIATSGKNNHMYGKKGKDNPNYGRGKDVYQYDIEGQLIKKWPNSNIAANELDISRHGINLRCVNNSYKHYKGYLWSYNNQLDIKEPGVI